MNTYSVMLIGLALAMDACGVAISIGLNCHVERKNKLAFILSFSFFQFLFAFIGSFLGKFISEKIVAIPSVIGAIVIFIVGFVMIKEGMEEKDECILVKPGMALILGVSVSIDALVVGVIALSTRGDYIFTDAVLVGLITLILVTLAFMMSKALAHFPLISKYSDYLGGVILIIFSLRMLLM